MMFRGQSGFGRMPLAAAVGVSCLVLAACGGGAAASRSAVPSASSTADPLAGLTVAQLEGKVIASTTAASSVTLQGTTAESGQRNTVDLAIKPGQGCTGTLGLGSDGNMKLTEIGSTVYLNLDNKYWEANAGTAAPRIIALVDGKYIKVSANNKGVGNFLTLCDLSQMFSTNGKKDTVTKGKVTTREGVRVLTFNDLTDGSTGYVADTSNPRLIALSALADSKNGAENITATYDAPVTLAAPPASQVIAGSKIGM